MYSVINVEMLSHCYEKGIIFGGLVYKRKIESGQSMGGRRLLARLASTSTPYNKPCG